MSMTLTISLLALVVAIINFYALLGLYRRQDHLMNHLDLVTSAVDHYKDLVNNHRRKLSQDYNECWGRATQGHLQAQIAKVTAERAFTLASQSQVLISGISSVLQRRPLPPSKEDLAKNEIIRQRIQEAFGDEQFEYMKPLMSDEELEILDTVLEKKNTKNV